MFFVKRLHKNLTELESRKNVVVVVSVEKPLCNFLAFWSGEKEKGEILVLDQSGTENIVFNPLKS